MEQKQKIYGEAENYIRSQFLVNTVDFGCKFNLQQVVHDKLVADNSIKSSSEYYEPKQGEIHVSSL